MALYVCVRCVCTMLKRSQIERSEQLKRSSEKVNIARRTLSLFIYFRVSLGTGECYTSTRKKSFLLQPRSYLFSIYGHNLPEYFFITSYEINVLICDGDTNAMISIWLK